MKRKRRHNTRLLAPPPNSAHRSGLAPLELVLALPLLLSVMALIVNFSHAATWRVRSATAARLAMWRHRPLWSADGDPKPENYFPRSGQLGVSGGPRVAEVDPYWNRPEIMQGWIKGPIFSGGGGYIGVRNNRVNEMSEQVSKGTANVQTRYPFLPSMGVLRMSAENTLLDSVWQFHTMGYSWNEDRRAEGWWQLESAPEWATLRAQFLRADQRMTSNPERERLRPLDRDIDLINFFGDRNSNSDFYPIPYHRPYGFCNDDLREVRDDLQAPGGFLDEISGSANPLTPGVCERMARSYLTMFQAELAMLQALPNPPAARIAQLEQWIEQLTDFITKLQASY